LTLSTWKGAKVLVDEKKTEDFDLGIPFEGDEESKDTQAISSDSVTELNSLLQESSDDGIIDLQMSDEIDLENSNSESLFSEKDEESNHEHPQELEAPLMTDSEGLLDHDSEFTQVSSKLEELGIQMQELQKEFKAKLKYDSHKDKMIDALHKELQDYKNDPIKKHVHSIIIDIIKVVDDIRKLSLHYRSLPPSEMDPEKIMEIIDKILSDLEDLFLFQGVKPYVCHDDEYDPKRQRVMKRIRTDDPSKDKTIAESIRPGYEWDGKVVRPEMVAVYLFRKTEADNDTRSSDD
jgi:molecular chaperone GrpE (heat shock protein)